MATKRQGFTLIELMIVISIIVIIATVALPNFLGSKLVANETAAISTLRTLVTGQNTLRNRGSIDVDNDGTGEYGYFAELSGMFPLRGMGFNLAPAELTSAFGTINPNGEASRSGYYFQIYLPDANGIGVAEDAGGGKANPATLNSNLSEVFWCAYAWPSSVNNTGRSVFFVNQEGDVLQAPNQLAVPYTGTGGGPSPEAAFIGAAPGQITGQITVGQVATDAQVWTLAP